jgi:hypothetical protein
MAIIKGMLDAAGVRGEKNQRALQYGGRMSKSRIGGHPAFEVSLTGKILLPP